MSQTEPGSREIFPQSDRIASGSVVIFLKEPRPGAVKTRLAADLGAPEAARLYELWTTAILEGLQPLRGTTLLIGYYAGHLSAVQSRWDPLVDEWLVQPDGDLGARLDFAFETWLLHGPAIAIGTDCLDVDAALLRTAFNRLAGADAVIGPAADGGYYLLGLKRYSKNLFDGVAWSSPQTFVQQRESLRQARMTVTELSVLHDIDTLDDWLAFQRRRP